MATTDSNTKHDMFDMFAGVDFSAGTGAKERVWARVQQSMDVAELDDSELDMLAAAGNPFDKQDFND